MEILKQHRQNAHLTFRDMARILQISKTYYWQLEHEKRRLSYPMATKIANVFQVRPDDLFYDDLKDKHYKKRRTR